MKHTCGWETPIGAKFCRGCGHPLGFSVPLGQRVGGVQRVNVSRPAAIAIACGLFALLVIAISINSCQVNQARRAQARWRASIESMGSEPQPTFVEKYLLNKAAQRAADED